MVDQIDIPEESARPGAPCQPDSAKRPSKWPIYLLLTAAVIVPAMFWQRVWFGTRLSDEEIRRRLTGPETPREVLHACEQISQRMQKKPDAARQFYDLLVPLADHSSDDVRCAVAWCMGEDDTQYAPFHRALLRLLEDEAPRVRHNAALALARFGDPAARPVLREMLLPCPVLARWSDSTGDGVIVDVLHKDDPVQLGTQVALVKTGAGDPTPLLAPIDGHIDDVTVRLGQDLQNGDRVCTITPGLPQVYAALRALTLVGQAEDIGCIESYVQRDPGFSSNERAQIQAQARLATDAIRKRHEQKGR